MPSLRRSVPVDLYLPPSWEEDAGRPCQLLIVNDGQDLPGMAFGRLLENLIQEGLIRPIIAAGVHAGNRMEEYGTAGQPDYLGRGKRAADYQRFLLRRLIPLIRRHYPVGQAPHAVAGFSLGGLSAFDLAWHHPTAIHTAGIFSGALWWRSQPFRPEAPDADRIAHAMVETGTYHRGLRFWFQAGTRDEQEDRNGNGIIDAIDDTLQLMALLRKKGYQPGKDLRYIEVQGGTHQPATWASAFPDFLQWAFPPQRNSKPPGPIQHLPKRHGRGRQPQQ